MSEEEIDPWDLPEEERGSEFGKGVIICLAKFSEHLWNRWAENIIYTIRWQNMTDEERQNIHKEMEIHPHGDASRHYGMIIAMEGSRFDNRDAVSSAMELWANGASDHFYDLERDLCPPSLVELADLTLTMGHGFTGQKWTEEDWKKIQKLWEDACYELDLQLGVENPDWGNY